MMIKKSVHQVDTGVLNTCASDHKVSEYMKQKLIAVQEVLNKSTLIAEDFNTSPSVLNKTSGQKISVSK